MRHKSEYRTKLDDFERKMDLARVQYENYFSGIDGREPIWLRNEINKIMKFFRRCQFKSSTDRNRFSTLASRYGILSRNWDTVLREQEEGHYRKQHMRGRSPSVEQPNRLEVDSNLSETDTAAPLQINVTDASKPQTEESHSLNTLEKKETSPPIINRSGAFGEPYVVSVDGFVEEGSQALYATYIQAKQQCGESIEELSFQSFAKKIARLIPQLEQKGYTRLQFQIFIDGGEATMKPMGKKTP